MEIPQNFDVSVGSISGIGADDYIVNAMRREHNSRRMWLFFAITLLASVAAFIAKA